MRKLTHILIQDYKGIAKFDQNVAGAFILVRGRNGSGKSSFLEAVQWVFEGGHQPSDIRGYSGPDGKPGQVGIGGVPEAKRALVRLTFDDSTVIERHMTRSAAKWNVTIGGIPIVEKNEVFLGNIARGFSFDPMAFVRARPEERFAFFVQVCGLQFTAAEVNGAAGVPLVGPTAVLSIEQLAALRKMRYERRTEVNRSARDAEGAYSERVADLPADDGTDWSTERSRLEREVGEIETRIRSAALRHGALAEEAKARRRAAVDGEIRALEEQIKSKMAGLLRECELLDSKAAQDAAEETTREQVTLTEKKLALVAARQGEERATRAKEVRSQADNWQRKMVEHTTEADALTRQIEALDELRAAKLRESPVEGVEIGDLVNKKGDITGKDLVVSGVPWAQLNTSEQMLTAMKIGLQGAGDWPGLISDYGSEFDNVRLEDLRKRVQQSDGIQLIIAVAEPEPLTVEVS